MKKMLVGVCFLFSCHGLWGSLSGGDSFKAAETQEVFDTVVDDVLKKAFGKGKSEPKDQMRQKIQKSLEQNESLRDPLFQLLSEENNRKLNVGLFGGKNAARQERQRNLGVSLDYLVCDQKDQVISLHAQQCWEMPGFLKEENRSFSMSRFLAGVRKTVADSANGHRALRSAQREIQGAKQALTEWEDKHTELSAQHQDTTAKLGELHTENQVLLEQNETQGQAFQSLTEEHQQCPVLLEQALQTAQKQWSTEQERSLTAVREKAFKEGGAHAITPLVQKERERLAQEARNGWLSPEAQEKARRDRRARWSAREGEFSAQLKARSEEVKAEVQASYEDYASPSDMDTLRNTMATSLAAERTRSKRRLVGAAIAGIVAGGAAVKIYQSWHQQTPDKAPVR